MKLSLKPPTWAWFLPNGLVHLSEEEPGPIEIDFDSLPDEDKRLVVIGIQSNKILSDEPIKPHKLQLTERMAVTNTDEDNPHILLSEDDLKKMSIKKLNLNAPNIKKYVDSENNIRLLRIMLELESSTRNRKPIVTCLEDKLDLLTSQIHASIQNEKGTIVPVLPDPLADQLEVTDIIEEERSVEVER